MIKMIKEKLIGAMATTILLHLLETVNLIQEYWKNLVQKAKR